MLGEVARHPRRDHIVRISKFYSLSWVLKIFSNAAIVGLLFPYKGPEASTPSYLNYMASSLVVTVIFGVYYLAATHWLNQMYNCWAWLVCCVCDTTIWATGWVDATYNAGVMATGMDADPVWSRRNLPLWGAAAGLAGLNLVLAVTSTIWYGRKLHHHRYEGRPYVIYGRWHEPVDPSPSPPASNRSQATTPFIRTPPKAYEMPSYANGTGPRPMPESLLPQKVQFHSTVLVG